MAEHGEGARGMGPFVEIAVDGALRVTGWDPRAEQVFGVSRAEALGQAIAELVPVDGGEAAWRTMLIDDDAAQVWPLARAGEPRVLDWFHRCLFDADGQVCGAVCYGRDVTARATRERQRDIEHQMLTTIYDNLNIGAWAIDANGTFLVHKGRASLPGPDVYLGRNLFELFGETTTVANVRRALSGESMHTRGSELGRDWESWMIPMGPQEATDVAVIGISLDVSEIKEGERALRDQLEVIERQQQAIRAMSTPIIEVWDGVLTLPILGLVDSVRTAEIMENLLQAVTRVRARFAILDMTGVEVVDTSTAGHLLGLVQAIRLLGAEGIITGIHPNIAQTMVALGVDLSRIVVHSNLREALKYCISRSKPR